MDEFEEVKNLWQAAPAQPLAQPAIVKEELDEVIKSRIKKEKKGIAEYFWLSFTFQILIYSLLCHLIIRFRGYTAMVLLCVAGVLLYLPFTIILMRKFKAMFKPVGQIGNVQTGVKTQYKLLAQFFSFKKKFDFVAIPVNSVILTGFIFKLYVPGGTAAHITGAVAACLAMVLIYGIAAWLENKKHFIKPLRRLHSILEDIGANS